MNHTKLPTKFLVLLAAPVLLTLAIPVVKAQSQTETKIRLMAEALRARDSGDLATAKTNLEQLLVLAPTDVTVQRLLSGVNDALAKGVTAAELTPALPAPSTPTDAVYNPNAMVQTAPAPTAAPAPSPAAAPEAVATVSIADEMVAAEADRVKDLISAAKAEKKAALSLARNGDYDAAAAKLDAASRTLPVNTLTQDTLTSLDETKNELMLRKSRELLKQGDTVGAKAALDGYKVSPSASAFAAQKQADHIDRAELSPIEPPISEASPLFLSDQKKIAAYLAKGRSQYAAGAIDEAQETYRTLETISADNAEAKYFLKRIADDKASIGVFNREKSRAQMLEEVAKSWQRPGVYIETADSPAAVRSSGSKDMMRKIENIVIPLLSFNQLPLDRVISTLSELAKENDASTTGVKGVNLVMINPSSGATAPQSVTLSDLSLKRMLDVITDMYSYTYTVENDIIRIKPSGGDVNLSTEQVSLSKAAFTRMTGLGAIVPSSGASSDPFAPAPAASSASVGSGGDSEAIRRFLQAAGVTFENVPGSSIAYDGSQVFVTQTDRNIEKILNIFKRYDDVRQVEIEAKFMDVAEGKLNEFGIKWGASGSNFNGKIGFGTNVDGAIQPTNTNMTNPLGSAVRGLTEASAVNTTLPGGMNLGAASGNIGTLAGASIGEFTVDAQLRALAQSSGSDLLSAPKATVLSDQTAVLEVVQLLKYPKTYSEATIEPSQVANGVIIPGQFKPSLPQEIAEEKVGVVLKVTPKVEDDGKIDLTLEPRVTEFEGFVDYGSAASVGGQTVVLPYLQPIFAFRSITTRVVVWDGATIVMGGLTREETRKVDDKIPVLGDMPFIGRLFKSKGESTQKRNLLIFVTANLVSPGGSLSRQSLKGVERGATFQNPTVVTPGGSESRIRSN